MEVVEDTMCPAPMALLAMGRPHCHRNSAKYALGSIAVTVSLPIAKQKKENCCTLHRRQAVLLLTVLALVSRPCTRKERKDVVKIRCAKLGGGLVLNEQKPTRCFVVYVIAPFLAPLASRVVKTC